MHHQTSGGRGCAYRPTPRYKAKCSVNRVCCLQLYTTAALCTVSVDEEQLNNRTQRRKLTLLIADMCK